MTTLKKIEDINKVIKTYFDKYPNEIKIPAKDLMPHFIAARIFPSDHKEGQPIRKVLRELYKKKQLYLIPYALPERKQENINWFFIRSEEKINLPFPKMEKKTSARKKASRQSSDEWYVIDLCDQILGQKGSRQHKFPFLLGDAGKNGKKRKLPVDAYYRDLNLVIEYTEEQHRKPINHFDKPHIKTISGVHRGEQRKIYDQRRREVLPQNGIRLIEIPCHIFSCNNQKKIIRNSEKDLSNIRCFLCK
ncbi:MAG: hypothetical protein WC770_06535 [Phycisphaerae bacterium]|jgi:hypothetical protein